MKKLLFIIVAIGLLTRVSFAQSFDKSKLDRYFDTLGAHHKFMGSVAVLQNGKIIYKKSVGFCDVKNKIKANENSKYRIGSISKTFTSVLIFKAIEGGKISLNQTIDKFFPEIENAAKITIGDLLCHRSGIHDFTSDTTYLEWNTKPHSKQQMIDIIAKGGSNFKPDSQSGYSNSNYVLLTFILEKIFKEPYADLLNKYITKPLGLSNTYLGGKINTQNNECASYAYYGKWELQPETDISIPSGAGGIVSTPTDLVKFSDALFTGKLISTKSLEQMKTAKGDFGMGLIQAPFYDMVTYGHTGGIDGFSADFCHIDHKDISYALTSNGMNYDMNSISIAVLNAVYGYNYNIPEFKVIKISSEELNKYSGVYSSAQFPLKITITKEKDTLTAQATGQSSFPLEATGKDKFEFEKAGIVITFDPLKKTLTLNQGGQQFIFTKE